MPAVSTLVTAARARRRVRSRAPADLLRFLGEVVRGEQAPQVLEQRADEDLFGFAQQR